MTTSMLMAASVPDNHGVAYDLERSVIAQKHVYDDDIAELRAGEATDGLLA